jgi:hypothetical protein
MTSKAFPRKDLPTGEEDPSFVTVAKQLLLFHLTLVCPAAGTV